jgi:hydroxymethylpyrimidine/phosphomethylpyrimidine kinase
MRTALTIAGSDSGGGAGIQADLKTFAAHGVYGTTAITAVTAQNTLGVAAVFPLPSDIVTAQIEAVAGDIGFHAAKTGMLATAAIVEAVAAAIEALEVPQLVVDPVMIAKSGDRLLEADAVAALKTHLLPQAYVVTPNLHEAELLGKLSIRSRNDMKAAATRIKSLGPSAVIIKGGHLETADSRDLLYDGHEFHELQGERIDTPHTHGTGCTFSAAVAANLALGHSLVEAATRAKIYVTEAIRHGGGVGRGRGPLHHFWRLG